MLRQQLVAILGENVPAFCCHPVYFGHLGRKCSGQGVFMRQRWFLAILRRKCTGWGRLVSAGRMWPF